MLLLLFVSFTPAVESAETDKERWNEKYSGDTYRFGKDPIPYLVEHLDRLPKGKALNLAMGEGRNGVFLATKGFQVTGLDISEKGLEKAQALAKAQGVMIETKVADLDRASLGTNEYDMVLCTYYLDRGLFPKMKQAVKPGGMVVVETYTMDHLEIPAAVSKRMAAREKRIDRDVQRLHHPRLSGGR